MADTAHGARCAVIVGPYTSGKTSLLEALLAHAGAISRQGKVADGSVLGDQSPEAKAHQMSVEPNIAHAVFLGEPWSFIDCPGSVELSQDSRTALMAADLAIVVAEPDPDRAVTLATTFRFLDEHAIPHLVFINKMDKASARLRDILSAVQAVSARPLVLRQVPIREGDQVSGFVDLVSERAFRFKEGQPSELIEMPEGVKDREGEARQVLLEALADFDDGLLEQLLEDKVPAPEEVYGQIGKDLAGDLIVPVLFGSGEMQNGITRLWKSLRHDCPAAAVGAKRNKIPDSKDFAGVVVRSFNQAHTGKISLLRIWRGALAEGSHIGDDRVSGLYHLMGSENKKIAKGETGDLVAVGRMDKLKTGDLVTAKGRQEKPKIVWPAPLHPVYALAIQPENRQDEVKLTAGLAKLIEEDGSLSIDHNTDTHELVLRGQGEVHLKLALERLKSRGNVSVTSKSPRTAYKETIRKATKQHSRFKRQSGGHGQFGDVHVEIKPKKRGEGFEFIDKVVGGAIPRNFIPSVEHGVKDYLPRGPLGFPVVDVSVTLYDGQHHAVDSSDMAFKTAGRLAMQEGMPSCDPILLEPIHKVTLSVPNDYTNKIHSLVSSRRGQILGFTAKEGWEGWDGLSCFMPESDLADLIIELRSLTLGVGIFQSAFDHLQELTGRTADQVVAQRKAELEAQ